MNDEKEKSFKLSMLALAVANFMPTGRSNSDDNRGSTPTGRNGQGYFKTFI